MVATKLLKFKKIKTDGKKHVIFERTCPNFKTCQTFSSIKD